MDEKTKLYVFARSELFLIFGFILVMAISSFVFGVKVGKNYSYMQAGLTEKEQDTLEMLSGQEELVKNNLQDGQAIAPQKEEIAQDSHSRLTEIINKEFEQDETKKAAVEQVTEVKKPEPSETVATTNSKSEPEVKAPEVAQRAQDEYTGKWTIQLGSHQNLSEAERFAEGFKIRGYQPIINEAYVPNKGTWYRVSLGIFETMADAKDYVLKEKTLFEGQEYVFGRFE